MKVIVTGGAGFIGSDVACALEARGARVTVIDDFTSGSFVNLKAFRGEVVAKDINDVAWDQIPRPDAVIHQAAVTDTTLADQKRVMHANVEGFRKLTAFCLKHRTKLVFASSAAVYGNEAAPQAEDGSRNPLNVYAYSKWVADQMAQEVINSGRIPVIGLRYFNVFGRGEQHKGTAASMIYQLAEQMRNGKRPRIFYDGEQHRDHIYVNDVVAANLKALEADKSGIVNVGTGVATTFNRLIEILNEVLATNLAPDYFENPYDFYQNETRAVTTKAVDLIGFQASYTVEEGIRDYVTALYDLKPAKAVPR